MFWDCGCVYICTGLTKTQGMNDIQVKLNDKGYGQFYIMEGDAQIARMDVGLRGNDLIVYHTEADPKTAGQGLGKKLLEFMIAYVREHHYKVIPYCPFVRGQFKKHPELYQDVWRKKGKLIDHILEGREKSIGTETVLQSLPHKHFRFANPFIVLHHLLPEHFEPGSEEKRLPPHPHRGFAPVTFMFQGENFHRDSKGNTGYIKAGDVQWMFAGSGLLHSEGPSKEFLQRGGDYEFIQLWVNVPKERKMDEPFYQQASSEKMPTLFTDAGANLKLASGHYANINGPLKTMTPVTTMFGSVPKGVSIDLICKDGDWTLLYILSGSININTMDIAAHNLLVFNKTGTDISFTATEDAKILYLTAEPIDEPVAAKGNIVMNTEEEVQQAEVDIAAGKFGQLDF